MNKKRVLVISDSLGLPRENPDGIIYYENSWPYLLKEKFDVIHLGIGGASIDQLVSQAGYYRFANPDFVILQSGIVDCAPRTMTKKEKENPRVRSPLVHRRTKQCWLKAYQAMHEYPAQ